MVTKTILCNLIALFALSMIDRGILDDAIQRHKWMGYPFGLWALVSIFSIPVWLIYLIITW